VGGSLAEAIATPNEKEGEEGRQRTAPIQQILVGAIVQLKSDWTIFN
jgi:hypothetical protein